MPESGPRVTHELEQLSAALRDAAPVLRTFHESLTRAGFRRSDATELTRAALTELMRRDDDRGGGAPP